MDDPSTADHGQLGDDFADLIERFDHVSMAVPDIRAALALPEMLGGRLRAGGVAPGGFRWAQWYLPGAGRLEMVSPLDLTATDHFLVRFLDRHGSGLHHVTFKVHDIDAAIARGEKLGFDVVGIDTTGSNWKEAFLHPRSTHGVLIQLAEWTDRPDPEGVTIDRILDASR